jgi:hypothetical protein
MFRIDEVSGLLASKFLSKKKEKNNTDDKKLADAINKLAKTQSSKRLKGVQKLDREKELREQEEQTTLLKKILGAIGKSSKKSKLLGSVGKVGKVAGVAGIAGAVAKFWKKGGILGLITTAFSDTFDAIEKQVADAKGVFVEDLGFKDRFKAFVSTFGEGTVGLINSALSALHIDYQIPEGKVTEIVSKVDGIITNVFDNFVANTGKVGEAIQAGLKSVDDFVGKTLDGAFKQFRMLTDVFMKQTPEHKEFIKLVKELDDMEGSKGYVSDEQKAEYEKKKARATELAKKLQSNKDFVKHSGYQFVAQNLLDPAKQAKIQAQMAKNKVEDKQGIIAKTKAFLTGKQSDLKAEQETAKAQEKKKFIEYVETKHKKYTITKDEKDRYNNLITDKRDKAKEKLSKLVEKPKSEIEKYKRANETLKRLMVKDPAHADVYRKTITANEATIAKYQKELEDNKPKIEALKKEISKYDSKIIKSVKPTNGKKYEEDLVKKVDEKVKAKEKPTGYEKARYKTIQGKKENQLKENISIKQKGKEDAQKEITKLDEVIAKNKELMTQDAKNKEEYQAKIDEAQKRREELQKKQDETTKQIDELQKKLAKLIDKASDLDLSGSGDVEVSSKGGSDVLKGDLAVIASMVRSNEVRNNNYGQTEILKDGAGISFGGYQLTERGGNLYKFMQNFAQRNTKYKAQAQAYLKMFSDPKHFAGDKKQFMKWLRKIGNNEESKRAQDQVFIQQYYNPAKRLASKKGITDNKAIVHIIDHTLNAGAGGARKMLRNVKYGASSQEVAKARLGYYKGLRLYSRYGKSWTNRVAKIQRMKAPATVGSPQTRVASNDNASNKKKQSPKVATNDIKKQVEPKSKLKPIPSSTKVAQNNTQQESKAKNDKIDDSKLVVAVENKDVVTAIQEQTKILASALKIKMPQAGNTNQTVVNYTPSKQAINDMGA